MHGLSGALHRALKGNSLGIRKVGGKASQDEMMIILETTSNVARTGLEASTDLGLANLALFEVDEEVFPFLFLY